MSSNANEKFPDRIVSLIMDKHLEKPVNEYNREEIAGFTTQSIIGIGKFYSTRLKRKARVETISDLAKLDHKMADQIGISQKLLEKWTLSASIIYRYATSTEVPISSHRVCIAGLGAVGKSSLIKTLQAQKTTPVNFPTMGATIEHLDFIGLRIAIWDLGGQPSFHRLYLDDPKQFLSKTMLLIFVLDTQREERAIEAAQYLNSLLIKFKYLKEKPKVYLVLHKFDPILDKNELNKSIEVILNEITPILTKYNYTFRTLRTSIFNVEELVKLFSRVFADVSPLSNILSDSLAFYSEAHGFSASFLLTERCFIAAEWTTQLAADQRDNYFLEIMEAIRKEVYESDKKHEKLVILSEIGGTFIIIDRLEFDSIKLFLCSISTEFKTKEGPVTAKFIEEIRPWIINFFSIIT
ncbi:MAG: 50S ribosome-binding GTPase [Candidatus Heimdallarchaeota archaeon]|nr:MAG: 50S ribosome-binding GTPase [Candidatus Heimdallarchaeota archaeon]